ncbi:MAG: bifunctional UDP-N-acetylglucosamine diphosphorylase/glucosamine-1-phosphate N-acetyltransferase GlmU [Pseudonocardia sp.]|nr:bifunctional UDP-N-acetylglucosamine diphosphorylase/glucosamine-1-phosphate N-acetyltransferase GlmU [Pseudonocardia sp.]
MPDPTGADPTGGGSPRPAAVIVLAAGEGTRMRSATPKVLHPIGGRTLLGHVVHAAAGVVPEHLVVVIGHGADQARAELDALAGELDRPVTAAVQEKRLGTGHAVGCGLDVLPVDLAGPVVVTMGDTPLLRAATLRALVGDGRPVAVLTTDLDDPTGYGRIVRDPDGSVAAIVEQADATAEQQAITEVNAGVYAFDAAYLRAGIDRLDTANAQGELYLTDIVAIAAADGRPARGVRCADAWEVRGVNDRVHLAAVRAELNRRLVEEWMRAGVTVVDPATTWLDMQVVLEPDVVLHPGTQLHGATRVAAGAEIGPDTTLTSCTVGADARVRRTHGSEARIGAGAVVGPFTYLRPGTSLGERGKLGAFVEVKNSDIGTGSKVPHLTYVGDATVGEHTNIGCSSVVVNYDGVTKSRTRIGSHVRIGSDNTLVAPVTVGDGAYTGAGTVVREDVPPGALAVSSGPQRNVAGWVERKRAGTPAADAARAASSADKES